MTKQERLAWIRQRCDPLENAVGELPVSNVEIREEMEKLDSFREFQRGLQASKEALTSDEG